MIKTILFDFDGVIAESVNVKTKAFYNLYLPYGIEIAQKVRQHHIENGGMSRFEKFRLYHKDFLNIDLDKKGIEEFASQFSDLVLQGVIDSPFVNGADVFLEKFYKKLDFYVITGTPTNEIKVIVEKKNLSKYFKGLFGSPEKKDYWAQKIIDENNFNKNETVFIGDALADYNAAVSNDIKFILRETDDNIDLFKNIDVPKMNDLTSLEKLLDL